MIEDYTDEDIDKLVEKISVLKDAVKTLEDERKSTVYLDIPQGCSSLPDSI